jgi:hypothetical protein
VGQSELKRLAASAVAFCNYPSKQFVPCSLGRILKRGGGLTHLDAERIAREAGEANAELRNRANWW